MTHDTSRQTVERLDPGVRQGDAHGGVIERDDPTTIHTVILANASIQLSIVSTDGYVTPLLFEQE